MSENNGEPQDNGQAKTRTQNKLSYTDNILLNDWVRKYAKEKIKGGASYPSLAAEARKDLGVDDINKNHVMKACVEWKIAIRDLRPAKPSKARSANAEAIKELERRIELQNEVIVSLTHRLDKIEEYMTRPAEDRFPLLAK